jgi:hypothetical protein
MKTKLLLLIGAITASCTLTSCEIDGCPTAYGYGGVYGRPYYNNSGSYGGAYSRPLLSYNSYNLGRSYASYPRTTRSYGTFNRGGSCPPQISHSYSGPLTASRTHSVSSFGGSRSFGSFGPSSSHHSSGRSGGGFTGGSRHGGGHHH